MDELLLKQLIRQMKILNLWVTIAGTLILVALAVAIYMLFKVVTFVQDTSNRLNSIQENTQNTLNVQKQLCESESVGGFLEDGVITANNKPDKPEVSEAVYLTANYL